MKPVVLIGRADCWKEDFERFKSIVGSKAFSNNFGDGWIVVELGSEPVSKKVMVLK